jgi:hypothetical protein
MRRLAAGLLHVAQSLTEQRDHVLIVECVKNHSALAPRPYDAGVPQEAKLVRDGRFSDAELTREVADAEFRPRQRIENPHTCRIAEHAKNLSQTVNSLRVKS